ncbi:hypothetical protein H112_08837 [Trichophyton rubrum D6]|uniref:Uncharacterized protein n=2 Tax=Trichophyton TaxID=5550 RepID=A0A022VMV6_TRIRU|nr:hypothetical protein H100_08858 [Trichophyton rubrum MR850]EZF36672.1 hypothetical protein H102_08819 [Trichophyton rubrum CBS 100081]EZF47264.1 hypothetical protein H103_08841 [Trichophyton rubrum CBS 288.86]EZF58002.1 hypothetical protein H104_08789 [Trichophyton rubrum CBS 289.86]EZF68508.1 hypothetical protein H105_08844 [Trichophyton soudanense CBS 452.61]EZF79220.1 hypothetical protein H110_08842 [Trichophyton rubrum MR1448]EZF89820.1 hypothetical protein H113_08909 [Trichophyton rub
MARMHSERGTWREKAKEKETRNSSHLAQSGRTQGRTVVLLLPMLKRQGDTSSRQALAYTKVYKLDVDVDGPSTIIDKKKLPGIKSFRVKGPALAHLSSVCMRSTCH